MIRGSTQKKETNYKNITFEAENEWGYIKRRHVNQPCKSTLKPKVGKKYALCMLFVTNQEGLSLNCQMSCSWHSFTVIQFHWFAKGQFILKANFLALIWTKNEWNYFLISALASKNGSNQKHEGFLLYRLGGI